MNELYPQVWMGLPVETKLHLVKVFGLERTGASEIRDDVVVSDGFTKDDLKKVNFETMNTYIGSEEKDFLRAWQITLSKVHSELNPPVGVIHASEVAPEEIKHPTELDTQPESMKEEESVTEEKKPIKPTKNA